MREKLAKTRVQLSPYWWGWLALALIGILSAGTALSYFMSLPEPKAKEENSVKTVENNIKKTEETQDDKTDTLPEQFYPTANQNIEIQPEPENIAIMATPEIRIITYNDDRKKLSAKDEKEIQISQSNKKSAAKKMLQNPDRIIPTSKIIPIILYDEIHSELASKTVRAQVEQDIVGHTGWNVLIPKGSWAIGRYQPLKKFGDTRLMIGWERLITPEGEDIPFQGAAENSKGEEGVGGRLDTRMMERYGVAFLLGSLNAGAQFSLDSEDRNNRALADALGNSVDDVIEESTRQGLQLAPILHIKRGTRLSIQPLADIFFPEGEKTLSSEVSEPLAAPKIIKKESSAAEINDETF